MAGILPGNENRFLGLPPAAAWSHPRVTSRTNISELGNRDQCQLALALWHSSTNGISAAEDRGCQSAGPGDDGQIIPPLQVLPGTRHLRRVGSDQAIEKAFADPQHAGNLGDIHRAVIFRNHTLGNRVDPMSAPAAIAYFSTNRLQPATSSNVLGAPPYILRSR